MIDLGSKRQYKDKIKTWGFHKYKTSRVVHIDPDAHANFDGQSSAISSEVSNDDNHMSTDKLGGAIEVSQGNWLDLGKMQEQLPRLGDTSIFDSMTNPMVRIATSTAVEASFSPAAWPPPEPHQSISMPTLQGLSDDHWLRIPYASAMAPTHRRNLGICTGSFATSYEELQTRGAVSNLEDAPTHFAWP